MAITTTPDPFRSTRAHRAGGLLGAFTAATVLDAADVHVATTLVQLALAPDGSSTADDELVELAIAFAVRGIRHGSVTVDLATVAATTTIDDESDIDPTLLPWPRPEDWVGAVARSPLVAVGDDAPDRDEQRRARPIRLLGTDVALDRYWRYERAIASDLLARIGATPTELDETVLADGLARLFDAVGPDRQRQAAETALRRTFSVIAGGPGTGKTTTVAAVLALLHEQAASGTALRVALAAPTGKAAARLTEAIHSQARSLDIADDVRRAILAAEASTIHRLLGFAPGSKSRFRHDRTNQLPHQVVIVDETSMVSLTLMARLVEAVRPSARLVLVGDPQQLASVEAGAVLGDIVGPAAAEEGHTGRLTDSIVVLRTVHRYTGAIGDLAHAVESGDADAACGLLASGAAGLTWHDVDVADARGLGAIESVRPLVTEPATRVIEAARAGDAERSLHAMKAVQVLCAHRRGPHGVAAWRFRIEGWLAAAVPGSVGRSWYPGRPLLVTENDYSLDLFNGDTGVAVRSPDDPDRLVCAFERRGGIVTISPSRLRAVETLYAMTIHKSQGSQFGEVVVVLPDESSPILTRELLYTAVTRAEDGVTILGTEAAIRAAINRPVSRASGLRDRLWA